MDSNALDRHITGNYGEDQFDAAWDSAIEEINDLAVSQGLEPQQAVAVFNIGLEAFNASESILQDIALQRAKEDALEAEMHPDDPDAA